MIVVKMCSLFKIILFSERYFYNISIIIRKAFLQLRLVRLSLVQSNRGVTLLAKLDLVACLHLTLVRCTCILNKLTQHALRMQHCVQSFFPHSRISIPILILRLNPVQKPSGYGNEVTNLIVLLGLSLVLSLSLSNVNHSQQLLHK